MEQFIIKHYSIDDHPILKGNGFDGLIIGEDRDEADEFVNHINTYITVSEDTIRRLNEEIAILSASDAISPIMKTSDFKIESIDERGYYIINKASSGRDYLHKDNKLYNGIQSVESGFWKKKSKAKKALNRFVNEANGE